MKKVSKIVLTLAIFAVVLFGLKLSAAEVDGSCSQPLYCRGYPECQMHHWIKYYLDGSVDCCGQDSYGKRGFTCSNDEHIG